MIIILLCIFGLGLCLGLFINYIRLCNYIKKEIEEYNIEKAKSNYDKEKSL